MEIGNRSWMADDSARDTKRQVQITAAMAFPHFQRLAPELQAGVAAFLATSEMSYTSSRVALSLPCTGLKSTTSSFLTAKTESFSRYLLFLSKIWVVRGSYLSLPAWSQSWLVSGLSAVEGHEDGLWLTMMWMWAGR